MFIVVIWEITSVALSTVKGAWKDERRWTVFWYGLESAREVWRLVEHALDKEDDFLQNGNGVDKSSTLAMQKRDTSNNPVILNEFRRNSF